MRNSKPTDYCGDVPRVSAELQVADRLGTWKARWAIGRMDYAVGPGLYAVGDPKSESPVLVSANYKMSFDRLRSQLGGLDAWILVLDTRGINVWCAAGKGTFSTDEIVRQVEAVELAKVVTHRRLIVDRDACMECGACAGNCPTGAITVQSGVGCAAAVIRRVLRGTEACCDCS